MNSFAYYAVSKTEHGPGVCEVFPAFDPVRPSYYYRVPRGQRRAFRAWLREVWQSTDGDRSGRRVKIIGHWPHYSVEMSE